MVFIQEPERGADFSHEGNMAKRVKGKAKAKAKPNIPTAGPMRLPEVAKSTNKNPIIGPVQEKLTKESVKAIKKMEINPVVLEALLSTALPHFSGRRISNHPKKLTAKITNNKQKRMLNTALVAKAFKALAPKMAVTAKPNATYMQTMDIPYVMASRMPFFLSLPARFKKKLTVMGMMGHTHGVNSANNPPAIPIRKI